MSQILEMLMVVSFGISWPASILKSYKARTAKGKSIFFLSFVEFGYVCGIASKFVSGSISYVVIFYIINFCMVLADILLYVRNTKLDKASGR